MPRRAALVVAIAAQILLGCDPAAPSTSAPTSATSESPAPMEVPVGGRLLIIEVSNTSDRNAVLLVGEDAGTNFPDTAKVGNANPPLVPPHATIRVAFTVPNTANWAIFVNPSPEYGPILLASELARCVGLVPIVITVRGNGVPSWTSKARDLPPCMNN